MSLELKINEDIKQAMLAKNKDLLEALRAVKSALLLANTEKADVVVNEEAEIKILQKLVKQRRETAEIYTSQNRRDLADIENFQADVIQKYLPEQMGEEELTAIIKAIITETGASSIKDMGRVMGAAAKKLAGKADNKAISEKVKLLLGI
ncbi:MAG TPA: GatB/YqeY domain-containing protein [Bacteroidales bacterium]|nr:GatB/YqeY domain-containing protein [Bacteroidales bacterium]